MAKSKKLYFYTAYLWYLGKPVKRVYIASQLKETADVFDCFVHHCYLEELTKVGEINFEKEFVMNSLNNRFIRFGKRKHRGALEDSLRTADYISEGEFFYCLPHYHFYAYDERCRQILFISDDLEHAEWSWLFIEI